MKEKTKRKIKIEPPYIIMSIFLILLLGICTMLIIDSSRTKNADSLIRIDYNGIENLFHAKYEYHAVKNNKVHCVSKFSDIENMGVQEDIKDYSIYNSDDTTNVWLVYLVQSKNGQLPNIDKYDTYTEASEIGNDYIIGISNYTKKTKNVSGDELELFKKLVLDYHEQNPTTWSSDSANEIGHVILEIRKSTATNKYIAEIYNKIYLIDTDKQEMIYIMDIPDKGELGYWYSLS